METSGILLLAGCGFVIAFIGLTALAFVLVGWMGKWFRRLGGWAALAGRFPGPAQQPTDTFSGPIQMGPVYYRFGAVMDAGARGLYLGFKGVYRYPPLLIP